MAGSMHAMVLPRPGAPLEWRKVERPRPGPGEIGLRVEACGVCRTDLHILVGELAAPVLPLIPGHEIVGRVEALGTGMTVPAIGQRVGIGWLGPSCGCCGYCEEDRENLCDAPLFTGYARDGGHAEHCVADARFVFPLQSAADPVPSVRGMKRLCR